MVMVLNQVEEVHYSVERVIAVAVIGVFTAFLIAFVTLWLMDVVEWRLFLIALSTAILVCLILLCVFKRTKHLQYVIALLVASLFFIIYFFLPVAHPWQLFLILVPTEALVILACNLRIKHQYRHKSGK